MKWLVPGNNSGLFGLVIGFTIILEFGLPEHAANHAVPHVAAFTTHAV